MMSIAEDMAAWVSHEAAREAGDELQPGALWGPEFGIYVRGKWHPSKGAEERSAILEAVAGLADHPEALICWIKVVRAWLEAWAVAFTDEFVRAARSGCDLDTWVPDDAGWERVELYVDAAVDECLREQLWPGILTERELAQVQTLTEWLGDSASGPQAR